MRRSWPDASEALAFEGQVLSRGAARIDFRLPVPDGVFRASEESVLFVAPPIRAHGGQVGYEVEVDAEGESIGLAPLPPERTLVVAREESFSGSHWLSPPPELSAEVLARLSRPDASEGDDELPLPVIPLARRRGVADALASAGLGVLGHSAAGRVARLGVALSLVFAVLGLQSWNAHRSSRPSFVRLASGDVEHAASLAPSNAVGLAVPTSAVAPAPLVITGAEPIWVIVAPQPSPLSRPPLARSPLSRSGLRARVPEAPAPGAPAEPLELPRPPPPPRRAEFARL